MAQVLFPRAIGAAVVLVVLTYLLPLMAGLGVMGTVTEWKTGYFTVVAKQVIHRFRTCLQLHHQELGKE